MLRPIPPQMAWQAITAFAGFFTLIAALAMPVDLWRLTVQSHQGEPFRATATLASRSDEHITSACLSMGPESDAPDSGMPFLRQADLAFDPARGTVDISTRQAIVAPAVALVLRVQCAGAPLYARHFTALIPPAPESAGTKSSTPLPGTTAAAANPPIPASSRQVQPAAAATTAAVKPGGTQPAPIRQPAQAQPVRRAGFHLSLLPGDTVASIAAVLFPGKPHVQQRLAQQVVAGNPRVFPDGRAREVPAGTVLWFPDLQELRKSATEKTQASGAGLADTPRAVSTEPAAGASAAAAQAPPKPPGRITLRRALALGDRPGAQECRQLMQLCGAEPAAAAPSPILEEKARTLQSGVEQLRLKQDSIDQQLLRIEQSIQALQKSIASAPAQPAQSPSPAPPRVEIRTVVKSEPMPWYVWLGLAGLVVVAALAGVAYGRRGTLARETVETDEQLDRMLATAATAMRELEAAPKPAPRPRPLPPRPPVKQAPPATPEHQAPTAAEEPEPAAPSATPDLLLESDSAQHMTELDVNLESAPPEPPEVDGLSSEVLYEMDQALDNTRSMFTDVDRFIALGRTQNALSLLQFQVHKDPKDRDSWIKLLAIYRQEKMDDELARAAREFKRNFPAENLPAG